MEDDWDLHAVVRGCAATSTTATKPYHTLQQDYDFSTCCFQDPLEPSRNSFFQDELHDLYKPFFPNSETQFSPLSHLAKSPPEIVKQLPQKPQSFSVSTGSKTHSPAPRSKRRKSHSKRVRHVAAENLSSDVWSWRKYGQKPIKGSPYPRGYYRCSTSKGCMARKQVERNRSDPGMFIVTYTAEHNHPMPTHRNSLAGTTRQKPAEVALEPQKPFCSPDKMDSSREDLADAEDDDDELSVSKMALDDDFFSGLEDFPAGECTDDGHFPASFQYPWQSTVATTTAGGG